MVSHAVTCAGGIGYPRADMKNLSITILAASVAVLALGCGGEGGGSALKAGEVAKNPDKYKGQKVKVTGIYAQGYSVGGKPTDPWALVIKDAPADKESLSCVLPAKVDVKGNYPKLTAEGTVEVETSGAKRINLTGCTYKLEP